MAVGDNVVGNVTCKLVVSILSHVETVIKEGLTLALVHSIEVHGASLEVGVGFKSRLGRQAGKWTSVSGLGATKDVLDSVQYRHDRHMGVCLMHCKPK